MWSFTAGTVFALLGLAEAVPSPSRPIESRQNNTPKNCNKAFFDNVIAQVKLGGSVATGSPYTPNTEPYTAGQDPYRERVLHFANNNSPLRIADICGLRINVVDNIAFELYLPSPEKWNQRFLTVGNGGFAGGASRKDMFSRVVHNWATMSTNTGHDDPSLVLNWGQGEAGKKLQVDWAYRAMNLSVPYAKAIVAAYYGSDKPTKGNYYSGCSTGGRQGIRQVEADPKSFDAMLIGAPAWNIKSFAPVLSRIGWLADTSGLKVRAQGEPTPTLADRIWALVYKECDGLDGSTTDGAIRNLPACYDRFRNQANNETLWASTSTTVEQRNAFLAIIEEFKNSQVPDYTGDGFDITAIKDLVGSSYLMDKRDNLDFTQQFAQYFLNKPSLKWDTDTNGATLIKAAEDWDGEVHANADPRVLGNGKYTGKTILYTGTSDGFVSSYGTRRAFNLAGGKDNKNLAYFELPGMPHCVDLGSGATNPPWYIGGVGLHLPFPNSVFYMPESAGFLNPTNDALMALVDWHEKKGAAPEQLISTAFQTWGDGAYKASKQRPICRFPKQQKLVNQEAVNQPTGWTCE